MAMIMAIYITSQGSNGGRKEERKGVGHRLPVMPYIEYHTIPTLLN